MNSSQAHAPLFMENTDSKSLVMFIHGFMGSPRLFDDLAKSVYHQGFSAASLLLPGHGGSSKDFASGTMERWQRHVDAEIERFSNDYKNVRLVGHSMGGLLALNAAVRFTGLVRSVFMMASPFKLALFNAKAAKTRIKMVFYRKSHPVKAVYLACAGIQSSATFWRDTDAGFRMSPDLLWRMAKPGVELKKLMHATIGVLPNVSVPVTAVYSRSDELTSFASLDILKSGLSGIPFDEVLLTDSLHNYFPEHERVLIEQTLLKSLA